MKLSTRSRYGMRALVDLALRNNNQAVRLKEIAESQKISLAYLEHLIIPLISAGIIKTTRGVHGGIELAKSPDKIKLKDILEALEGPLAPVNCLKDSKSCTRSSTCATRDVWQDMKEAMEKVLEASTLQDLAERQKGKELQPETMYYI
jgi:Rrf2 family transcriptional regulator, cysteine metabolism repressor